MGCVAAMAMAESRRVSMAECSVTMACGVALMAAAAVDHAEQSHRQEPYAANQEQEFIHRIYYHG